MGSADDIELTTTLLGLYECAVSPEKYPDLAERLEACLAGEPDASVLDRLENHSGAIWEKAVDLFLNVESGAADETCLLTLSLSRGCLLPPAWEQFLDRVRADDATRLRTFLDGRSSGPERGDLLLRAEAGIDGREEVYLARKGDGAIRIHRLRSELAPEVEALIVSQFGVTRSELRVLRGLAVGKTLKDLARDGGKSIETIRSQAKSTAAKMGLSRQTEISATLAGLARIAAGPDRPDMSGLSRMQFPDGRFLAFDRAGDPAGLPVVFFHDFSSSCRWPRSVLSQFTEAGLCLIAPSRAGYGGSTPNRLTQDSLFRRHVEDYRALVDHLALDRFRMLAIGTGFGLAYSVLQEMENRADRLVGLNVYPPILGRRDALQFPPGMYRAGALAALYAPRTCALISKYATRRAASAATIAELDTMTGARGPWDDRDNRFFEEFVRPNLRDLIVAGAEGVWRDCTCLTIDWTRAARPSPAPAIILHNSDFPFQPEARARDLAARLGLPLESLPRPYRHFVDAFGDVLCHLAEPAGLHPALRGGAGAPHRAEGQIR